MRVAVLGGGRSSEHDVSLASAESVRAGLAEGGHEAVDVRIDREGRWTSGGDALPLAPGNGLLGADVVFPALHGPFGEDGTVQGLLELLDVPYVGAGVLASSLSMDKALFKDLMAAHGVPQVDYAVVRDGRGRGSLGPPVFVKPARLGSSVGISKAVSEVELDRGLALAFRARPGGGGRADGHRHRGGVLGAGQPRARGLDARRDRDPDGRLVRLRGEVHGRRDGAGGAGPHAAPGGGAAARRGGVQDRRLLGDGAGRLLRDRRGRAW